MILVSMLVQAEECHPVHVTLFWRGVQKNRSYPVLIKFDLWVTSINLLSQETDSFYLAFS